MRPELTTAYAVDSSASIQPVRSLFISWGKTVQISEATSLAGRVYVLHCFQKKSSKGIETPKVDIDLIKSRLKDAEAEHAI